MRFQTTYILAGALALGACTERTEEASKPKPFDYNTLALTIPTAKSGDLFLKESSRSGAALDDCLALPEKDNHGYLVGYNTIFIRAGIDSKYCPNMAIPKDPFPIILDPETQRLADLYETTGRQLMQRLDSIYSVAGNTKPQASVDSMNTIDDVMRKKADTTAKKP